MSELRVVETREECIESCAVARRRGSPIGLVPTMGYLHAGHEALLREARRISRFVVATIFVNPAQFGPSEDLDKYPRDLEGDLELCRRLGVDLVFAPTDSTEMYPEDFRTWVSVEGLTEHFCGASREGHFRGVTTIVAKLFNLVRPDLAVFGEKDYQQLVTIRAMVRDLHMGLDVIGVPTVRERDGLAVSSRNALLGQEARRRAVCVVEGLRAARAAYASGERRAGSLLRACRDVVA